MRNSKANSTDLKDDYLISPIADEKGQYYDSRNVKEGQGLPKDADGNGAYHIALKGLWNVRNILKHNWDAEKPEKLNLNIAKEEWFAFVQFKPYRDKAKD